MRGMVELVVRRGRDKNDKLENDEEKRQERQMVFFIDGAQNILAYQKRFVQQRKKIPIYLPKVSFCWNKITILSTRVSYDNNNHKWRNDAWLFPLFQITNFFVCRLCFTVFFDIPSMRKVMIDVNTRYSLTAFHSTFHIPWTSHFSVVGRE